MTKQEIEAMISQYGISPVGLNSSAPQLRVTRAPKAGREAVVAQLKAAKPEIINYFTEQEQERQRAAEERREQIRSAFPGIDQLRACLAEWDKWRVERDAAMDNPYEILSLPAMPEVQYKDLAAQYPKAAAYLKAEWYAGAEDDRKATAGREAMAALIAGADVDATMNKMDHWLPESAIWD